MTQRNKLNWKERPFLAPINFQTQPLFNLDIRWQSKSHEGSLSTSRFRTAAKTLLAFISRAAWHAAPMLQHESRPLTKRMFWKVTLPSPSIFSTKDVCPISFTVSFCLYLYLQPREKCFFFKRWVTWPWHNIQRWNGSCILLAAWLSFRHAKLTAGGEGRVRILAVECVSFFLFFPFLPL